MTAANPAGAASEDQTRVLAAGAGAQTGRRCTLLGTRALVVGDTGTAEATDHLRRTVEGVREAGVQVDTAVLPPEEPATVAGARTVHDRMRRCGAEVLVAVGGGSVIDSAKLARTAFHEPWVLDRALWHRPSGLFALREPRPCRTRPPLVAVPTRPGSAAEVTDRVAVAPEAGTSRRLLTGETLRPNEALIDPLFSATLSRSDWFSSLAEILFRVLGPFLITQDSTDEIDRAAAAWVDELLGIGVHLAGGDAPTARQRLRVAEISVATATGDHVRRWAPRMAAWWCVQNTVAARTGFAKGRLSALALPTLLELAASGEPAFGLPERLEALRSRTAAVEERLEHVCRAAQEAGGLRGRSYPDEELVSWGREVHRLWRHHPHVAALGPGGVVELLRRVGF
ncbi:iron-containing alcohol dehydrogenase [Nocardiopsis baichengensis]|uniref:iron-containing alcohol dehydrogenase n=1 Tax=Nocardiopsis baichengensis TaxID=280240 RepID=UPI00034BC5FC|nr:iron-containing alcohol dehydrogenase [Nocardiopsis baichengensis]